MQKERETKVAGQFPKTRAEAVEISRKIRDSLWLEGCKCPEVKIEFIEPPGGRGYVHVEHDLGCPSARSFT